MNKAASTIKSHNVILLCQSESTVWSLPQAMLQWFHIYFVYPSMESTTTINKDNDFVSPVGIMHIEGLPLSMMTGHDGYSFIHPFIVG